MVPWNDIDTVLLDLDGTLLDLHFDTFFWREHLPRRFAERHGLSLEEARQFLVPRISREAGTLRWYCIDFWSRQLELDVLALKNEVAHLISVHAGTENFLITLRRVGKRLVLVTNGHAEGLALKMRRTGLGEHFDEIVCAHSYGAPKEDPVFWSKLSSASPFDPRRTLFVDDSLPVLRAARRFGIAHLFAVRRPDTQEPPRDTGGFRALDRLTDLLGETSA